MTYDSAGNPLQWKGNVLQWNRGRRLIGYGSNGYTYDSGGIRQSKTVNGITHTYYTEDGTIHKEELSDGNKLIYGYDESGIASIEYGNARYYVQKNVQGDVVALVDGNKAVVAKYVYDAWGNHKVYDGDNVENSDRTFIGNINPFRYRGYYYDAESGLYYLQTRYYDPEIGRFINSDSIDYIDTESINGLNLYCYCMNNPVMYVDPTGHFPVLALILGVTALAGLGLTIGGIATGNNTLTAVGLTMVAIPALISGGMAIAAGIGGATLTGIVGGVTTVAGICSGLFASTEYQEAFTGNNWMLDAGMSESWYNGLMLTTAAIATFGTFASSFCYNFNIKSIDKIGKLIPSNHPNEGYWGIRFKNARGALRSLELQNHVPHGLHFQLNSWNPIHMSVKAIRRWTWFLTRM